MDGMGMVGMVESFVVAKKVRPIFRAKLAVFVFGRLAFAPQKINSKLSNLRNFCFSFRRYKDSPRSRHFQSLTKMGGTVNLRFWMMIIRWCNSET